MELSSSHDVAGSGSLFLFLRAVRVIVQRCHARVQSTKVVRVF